uniref:Uncharacterized protein n=1 Tax=viral metagenome TaxID=1070528 RepID=A0A6M3JXN9_9ZZZZ
MEGKLERNFEGQIMCDKCGKVPVYSVANHSNALDTFVGVFFSKRKTWYLCLDCTRNFSALASRGAKK